LWYSTTKSISSFVLLEASLFLISRALFTFFLSSKILLDSEFDELLLSSFSGSFSEELFCDPPVEFSEGLPSEFSAATHKNLLECAI